MRIFVSYSHRQKDWVRGDLVPVLNAWGAEVLIDYERFEAGIALPKQVDDLQSRADVHLLVLTPDLALDEYENIDVKIGGGVFPKDLLAVIRESIQQHRHIIWLFAGSHQITELKHAEWTSYLVSARTIEIPFFTLDETRLLLTDPLKHSELFRQVGKRPQFDPELWGPGGIERVHAEAGGWPHLLQLIAENLVDFLNNEGAPHVTPDLMERALDEAVVSGQNVLYQLMRGESVLPGEWEYLRGFRDRAEQMPPADEAVRASLLRRQLVVAANGAWRLRVPLMGRWLRLRG